MHKITVEQLKVDLTLIHKLKGKQTITRNIDFSEDAQKQLFNEMFNLNFSSCNPFPSWPSAVKDTCLQFQCAKMAFVNITGSLFLGLIAGAGSWFC